MPGRLRVGMTEMENGTGWTMKISEDPREMAEMIDTLVEANALLASSLFVELVNLGLLDAQSAARRMHALAEVAANPLHRHPELAAALGQRIRCYAEGFERAHAAGARPQVKLQLLDGGKA